MINVLLHYGADVNIEDKDGRTPLNYLINYNYFDMIDILVSFNVDINKPNRYGQTPLHTVSVEGRVEIVKDLLERGADYTLRDNKDRTPKDLAIEITKGRGVHDRKPIIELLQSYEDMVDIKEPDQ
jgi:ankyrin repeat protein